MSMTTRPIRDDNATTFGGVLRAQRNAAGLTLRELAEASGIHFTYICKIENNAFPPPAVATIRRMAVALGCGPRALCAAAGRVDEPMPKHELEQRVLDLEAMLAVANTSIKTATRMLGLMQTEARNVLVNGNTTLDAEYVLIVAGQIESGLDDWLVTVGYDVARLVAA